MSHVNPPRRDREKFSIEIVPRHVHLSPVHWDRLFGKDTKGHAVAPLSQRGQFVFAESVRLEGPSGILEPLFVLGPCRKDTQVELSMSECLSVGLKSQERVSGDLRGSPGCRLIGPKGEVALRRGVIVPLPHLHLSPSASTTLGLRQNDRVNLELFGAGIPRLSQVVVRVHPTFRPALHLSHDQAAGLWPLPTAYAQCQLA